MEAGWIKSRIEGALYGGAIGDAMGGPVEGVPRDIIEELHTVREVTDMLPYVRKNNIGEPEEKAPPGQTTDDTHFKNLLCQAILKKGGRVDAEDLVNELDIDDKFAYLIMRMALIRLHLQRSNYAPESYGQPHMPVVDTAAHHGGKGLPPANGAVMMISPVGLLYPGQPHEAYLAGYEIACAIQQGYSADMAGVVAAGVAAAMIPDTDAQTVVNTMVQYAPGNAKVLLEATQQLVEQSADMPAFREAFHEKLLIHFLDPGEVVAVAAAGLLLGDGRFESSVLNAVNFGRDADSIATITGALAGALGGVSAIPVRWLKAVDEARKDEPLQSDLATGVYQALRNEINRARDWTNTYTALL